MEYALWLIPVALIGLAPSAIQDGPSWLAATIIALLIARRGQLNLSRTAVFLAEFAHTPEPLFTAPLHVPWVPTWPDQRTIALHERD